MEIDIDRVRELVALAKEADITELTVANASGRITIKKGIAGLASGGGVAHASAADTPVPNGTIAAPGVATPGPAEFSQSSALSSRFVPITAPIVGTVYLGEKPESEPLVRAGQRIKEGQLVCVVEAMTVHNDVTAPADGIIAQILAENGQPVEYGQELMILELENQ